MSKILLVGKGAPDRGGIPSFLETLRHGGLTEEHDIEFLNVAHAGVPEGGRVSLGNLRRTLQDVLAVRRSSAGRDLVHIHSALAPAVTLVRAAMLAMAARSRGCSVVVHAHGGGILHWLVNRRRRALVRVAMAPAHRVVAVWSAGEHALRQVLPVDRVRLVDNGVDIGRAESARGAHEPPRVLFVGLLTPRKGVIDLLDASRELRERGVAHELWLVGGTPDEGPAAEAMVRERIDEHVRVLGTRAPADMPSIYADVDAFCLPSWWEAMPLSILEAMAAGLPVVASDVGDVTRAVLHGDTGYVVPAKAPHALADALERVIEDVELRRRMGAAGRAHVERQFSSRATVAAVSALYAELESERR